MNAITAYRTMTRIKQEESDHINFFQTQHGSSFTRCYCTPQLYCKLLAGTPQRALHPVYGMELTYLNTEEVVWVDPKKHLCILLIGKSSLDVDRILLNKAIAWLSLGPGQIWIDAKGHLLGGEDWEKFAGVLVRMDFKELDHG